MTGQENRALAGKGRAKQKGGEWRKRKGREGAKIKGGRQEIKRTVKRKNSVSCSYSSSRTGAARYPDHVLKPRSATAAPKSQSDSFWRVFQ